MLRTRLWMGGVLIALASGVLVVDEFLGPWFPFLFVFILALALASCYELLQLLGPAFQLPAWLCYASVATVIVSNWPAHVFGGPAAWTWILGTFTAVVLSSFLAEMATYREPGGSVVRIALVILVAAYLGWLPSFLVQLRWPTSELQPNEAAMRASSAALALTIFVPKCCDIGAYFTGRFLGRHRMTPVLSPKKTWEGLTGGLIVAALAAFGINRFGGGLSDPAALGFGVTVGGAGVLGDLAESLVKRDCQRKDASQAMPGFGGVLDVVDSVLFAAPVAYLWLRV
jgi:phosphatidate cytidylyltransferase